jgi:hypothetical protein
MTFAAMARRRVSRSLERHAGDEAIWCWRRSGDAGVRWLGLQLRSDGARERLQTGECRLMRLRRHLRRQMADAKFLVGPQPVYNGRDAPREMIPTRSSGRLLLHLRWVVSRGRALSQQAGDEGFRFGPIPVAGTDDGADESPLGIDEIGGG